MHDYKCKIKKGTGIINFYSNWEIIEELKHRTTLFK